MTAIPEGSTAYLTVTFHGKDGSEEIPESVTWQLHDVGSGNELQEVTSLSPAASIDITIPPAANVIVRSGNPTEKRIVTVKATFNDGGAANDEYEYEVENLKFVS